MSKANKSLPGKDLATKEIKRSGCNNDPKKKKRAKGVVGTGQHARCEYYVFGQIKRVY